MANQQDIKLIAVELVEKFSTPLVVDGKTRNVLEVYPKWGGFDIRVMVHGVKHNGEPVKVQRFRVKKSGYVEHDDFQKNLTGPLSSLAKKFRHELFNHGLKAKDRVALMSEIRDILVPSIPEDAEVDDEAIANDIAAIKALHQK